MICLGLDTALGACSVALIAGDAVLGHAFAPMTAGQAEALAPMAEQVMRIAGRAFPEVERIAVTTGPGTFTGQRIGLAFARGLRTALKVPCVGMTTLEAIAAAVRAAHPGRPCLVASDARRGEAYVQAFAADGTALTPPQLLTLAHAAALGASLTEPVFAGTAAENVANGATVVPITQPDAAWVARLGLARAPDGAPPAPLYLRAPDAKLPGPLKPLPPLRAVRA
ncbi:MAG: tRNA (adenosine(37)-N6)-threonylcarbamoyltransferase complex dimerization subunit type 1 TsaB [Alphaproteobacteria bacterium]|nr:tRNA (adenosine(37)-N6)-threonylcarbamoyltransferase complex dimerization subunit type 1 TsaB [Alphaproteobacteria bacterium]